MKTTFGIACIALLLIITSCSSREKWNKIIEKPNTQVFLREMAETEKKNGVVKVLISDLGYLCVAVDADKLWAKSLAKIYCKKAIAAGIEVEGCGIYAAKDYKWFKWGMGGTILATYKNNN